MKREGFRHTKVYRLARILGITHFAAIGLLDCLWDLAFREAPQGDIGKLANEDIAIGCHWLDDPDQLILGLLTARLLDDTGEPYRLLVHDWPDHCEDGVHSRLARAGLLFANGKAPKTSKLDAKDRPAADERIAVALKAAGGGRRRPAAAGGSNAVPCRAVALPSHAVQETVAPQQLSLVPAGAGTRAVAVVVSEMALSAEPLFYQESPSVIVAEVMIRVFNAVWQKKKKPNPSLVQMVDRRRKEGWTAWRIVAMPVITFARCTDPQFRVKIKPSWLIRDGRHGRVDSMGRTSGGTDWLSREYESVDEVVIDKRLESIARQAGVLEDLLRVGVGVRAESGL